MKRFLCWTALSVLLVGGFGVWWWSAWRVEHSQDTNILTATRRYGMDPALIKAVIWKESCFNPRARGRVGEAGLMQLQDVAAQEWAEAERCYPLAEERLFHPLTNVMAGTWYLRKVLRRYARTDNPVAYALAEYNAGRANVVKWSQGASATNSTAFISSIGFPATRDYVLSIQQRRERYLRDFPPIAANGRTPR